jgi:hypothetical protein
MSAGGALAWRRRCVRLVRLRVAAVEQARMTKRAFAARFFCALLALLYRTF